MRSGREPWKILVMLAVAAAGLGLGAAGAHAPRMSTTLDSAAASAGGGGPARSARERDSAMEPYRRGADHRGAAGGARGAAVPGTARRGAEGTGSADRVPKKSPTRRGGSGSAGYRAASPPGPLLSDTWFSRYAYQVYPTSPSVPVDRMARALTGFRVAFHPAGATDEKVVVTDLSDNTTQAATFSRGDHLYFIETRLGDDGFDGETNYGDDGFILTDAQGHILGR